MDNYGRSPLFMALKYDWVETMKFLLENEADYEDLLEKDPNFNNHIFSKSKQKELREIINEVTTLKYKSFIE